MCPERNRSNFDYHVVALVTAAIARPDLLHEYLSDGKAKDPTTGRPLALTDATRWRTLREAGFPPDLLAQLLVFFEGNFGNEHKHGEADDQRHDDKHEQASPDIHAAFTTLQRFHKTLQAVMDYCDDLCLDPEVLYDYVSCVSKISQELGPAGVQVKRLEAVDRRNHAEDNR